MRLAITLILGTFLTSCIALPALDLRSQDSPTSLTTAPEAEGEPLRIWIPYVGQGDGTLFQLPYGKTLLIDAGPPAAGKNALLPLLRKLGISRIDALVITHYDLDHLGGVPSLLAGEDGAMGTGDDIAVSLAYDRGGVPWDNSPGYGDYLAALEQGETSRHTLAAGDALDLDPGVKIHCVAANGAVGDETKILGQIDLSVPAYAGKENGASVALLFEYANFRYLTAGDLTGGGMTDGFITPDVETLVGKLVGQVDVMHVNHHGSLSSSNENFVKATKPKAVFIQAGKDNPYNHPASAVVERWQAVGGKIYSTKGEMAFSLESKGNSFEIKAVQESH
ncbi:MAG: MBL fold metallo-hydrolase [Deltaproteobacteria bacterium]|nr:MBL fold metallo-hydrolase [Deltaproteobacteria bacterium]